VFTKLAYHGASVGSKQPTDGTQNQEGIHATRQLEATIAGKREEPSVVRPLVAAQMLPWRRVGRAHGVSVSRSTSRLKAADWWHPELGTNPRHPPTAVIDVERRRPRDQIPDRDGAVRRQWERVDAVNRVLDLRRCQRCGEQSSQQHAEYPLHVFVSCEKSSFR
jgi:hypothetical protein